MNNKIMLSIHHKYSELILTEKKTLEIRKSAPSGSHTYIIYMYETKTPYRGSGGCLFGGAGAVVGFFKCRVRIKTNAFGSGLCGNSPEENAARAIIAERACLSVDELIKYANGKDIYGLEVSTPIRFPCPRPLSDFGLTRAPQSWQYLK